MIERIRALYSGLGCLALPLSPRDLAGDTLASALLAWPARVLRQLQAPVASAADAAAVFRWRDFAPGLAGYAMFGVGYIGYMTFVIAWVRENGGGTGLVMLVWTVLGLATLVAPAVWATFLPASI